MSIAIGGENDKGILQNSLKVLKPKHETAVWFAKFILGHLSQRNKS